MDIDPSALVTFLAGVGAFAALEKVGGVITWFQSQADRRKERRNARDFEAWLSNTEAQLAEVNSQPGPGITVPEGFIVTTQGTRLIAGLPVSAREREWAVQAIAAGRLAWLPHRNGAVTLADIVRER